jgi:CubicO group peptidase (beta-lactamase class C family)
VNTFGFLAGELVQRADGRTLGTMLREDVAGPLGADVHIGLPDIEHSRVAEFLWPGPAAPEVKPGTLSGSPLMVYNAYFNPAGLSGAGVVNTAARRLRAFRRGRLAWILRPCYASLG